MAFHATSQKPDPLALMQSQPPNKPKYETINNFDFGFCLLLRELRASKS